MTTVDLTLPEGATAAEADLIQALGRLIRRRPTIQALKDLRDAGEPLITHANVAKEARKSRTLIGFEGCRYNAVRDRVTKAMLEESRSMSEAGAEAGRAGSSREIIAGLRGRIDELNSQKELLATRVNVALNVADVMQKKLQRAERDAERANARVKALQAQLDRRAGHGVVVDFTGGRLA